MLYNFDFRYTLAKIPVNTTLRLCFRKMVFTGKKENVSKNRAIIFAPNHRNALLDALMLVYASYYRKQIVFMARADIFGKKFVAWILKGMRIMPVFRLRDGKDNLDKNNEIFDNAARILKKNNPIALFPEARHNPKQSLLPLQKAVPRIVLPTEASVDFQLHSQIVPVSIYYRDINAFLSDAYITFGTPIEVSAYKELYDENPVLAINRLRQDLEDSLKSMVVNIWNDEFYNEYCHAIDWNGDRIAAEMFPERKDGFLQATHYIVRMLDKMYADDREGFDRKIAGFREANALLKAHGLTSKDRLWKSSNRSEDRSQQILHGSNEQLHDSVFVSKEQLSESFSASEKQMQKKSTKRNHQLQAPFSTSNLFARFTMLAVSAPLAFLGFLNGIFPVLINKKLTGLFKDKQFIPSARYASGLFFVPIFDLLQSVIIGIISGNWLLAIVYFLLMPPLFYFSLYWRKWYKTALRDRKVRQFAKQYPKIWEKVQKLIRFGMSDWGFGI